MRKTNETIQERNERINQAVSVYKGFGKNFFWLNAMVKSGELSNSEAGYILTITK